MAKGNKNVLILGLGFRHKNYFGLEKNNALAPKYQMEMVWHPVKKIRFSMPQKPMEISPCFSKISTGVTQTVVDRLAALFASSGQTDLMRIHMGSKSITFFHSHGTLDVRIITLRFFYIFI